MLELYGMKPWEVNELTLFQLTYLLGGITGEHGRVKLKPEEAMTMLGRNQARQAGL
jgi:hypothetical protein